MELKELHLISFGKFKNKTIRLEKGLNLIYGENEKGKSTIHSFIDGMFYGFLRPNVKTAHYKDSHSKYEPWSGSDYKGGLVVRRGKKDYKIERSFKKKEEWTKVYDNETGEDLTRTLNLGDNRILQPGLEFFGFNSQVFENTVFISQLASRVDTSLSGELRERISNLETSLDENISIEKALEDLDNEAKSIGSQKAPTRPYSQSLRRLEELRVERNRIIKDKDKYLEGQTALDQVLSKLRILDIESKDWERRYESNKFRSIKERLDRISQAERDLINIRANIKDYKNYKEISLNDYSRALDFSKEIDFLERKIHHLSQRQSDIESRLKSISNFSKDEFLSLSNIVKELESLDWEENYLSSGSHKGKKGLVLVSILAIGLGNYILYYFLKESISDIMLLLLGLVTSVLLLAGLRILRNKLDSPSRKISEIRDKKSKLIDGAGFSTRQELNESYLSLEAGYEENLAVILGEEDLRRELESLELEKRTHQIQLVAARKQLNQIFENNLAKDLEEFRENLEKKEKLNRLKKDQEYKESLIEGLLEDTSLEDLENKLKGWDGTYIEGYKEDYELDLKKKLEEEKSGLIRQREEIKLDLGQLESSLKKLALVEEEIYFESKRVKSFENRLKAIDLAKETINRLSKEIHSEYAPGINKEIARLINRITNGKYSKVRIDEDLRIGVENPETREKIDFESLSGGTIDQLYLSLRLGIMEELYQETFPLILDDPFVQYDDTRLYNVLNYISELAKERQIIIFVCQLREIDLLNKLKVSYNRINI